MLTVIRKWQIVIWYIDELTISSAVSSKHQCQSALQSASLGRLQCHHHCIWLGLETANSPWTLCAKRDCETSRPLRPRRSLAITWTRIRRYSSFGRVESHLDECHLTPTNGWTGFNATRLHCSYRCDYVTNELSTDIMWSLNFNYAKSRRSISSTLSLLQEW